MGDRAMLGRVDGKLADDELRPLRLQNGWYIQRYAPMARISVPYGELSSAQLRALVRASVAPACSGSCGPASCVWRRRPSPLSAS